MTKTKWIAAALVALAIGAVCVQEKSAAIRNNLSGNEPAPIVSQDKSAAILQAADAPAKRQTFTASDAVPLSPYLQYTLRKIATENGVPYVLALAVVEQESTFRADAENGGCYGYMQVSSVHAPSEILLQPEDNFRYGCTLLGMYHRKFGNWNEALVAYNCGEAGKGNQFSSSYSRAVLLKSERWANVLGEPSVLMPR